MTKEKLPPTGGGGRQDARRETSLDPRDPRGLHYTPRELDPLQHPTKAKRPIEREHARPKDTGRGGA